MDVLKYEDSFLEAGCMAIDIADQNHRYQKAKKVIEDKEFQELAITGIADEQQDTMVELRQLVDTLPYEELSRDYLESQKKIRLLREELERGLEEDNEAKLAIRALSSLVVEISPRVRQEAEELADRRIKELDDTSKERVWQEIKDATLENERLMRLYEDVGAAWEIPLLYSGHPDGLYLEDTIPVEPELSEKPNNGFNEFAERHIDQPEATQMIAYFFTKNVKKIVDALDIANYIYDKEVCDKMPDDLLRSRVTTLLGPERKGMPVPTMLDSEGLVLQYGWRKCLEWHGDKKKIIKILRIYRVYKAGEKPEDVIQAEHPEYEIVWSTNGYMPLPVSICEEQVEQTGTTPEEEETCIDEVSDRKIKAIGETKIENLDTKTRRAVRWGEFTIDVQQSVAELIERGVIIQRSQPVPLKLIRLKSGSRIMGTQESLRRMTQTGLISRRVTSEDCLQPEQIVAMHMLNTHGKSFRNGKAEALKIIARELDRILGDQEV